MIIHVSIINSNIYDGIYLDGWNPMNNGDKPPLNGHDSGSDLLEVEVPIPY